MFSSELQAFMNAAVDAVIMINGRGTIEGFNRSAERIFGYPAGEILGQNVSRLMPEPYRHEHDEYLARYAHTRVPHIIGVGRELEGQRKDGTCFPISLSVGEVTASDPPRFVGLIRDITAQRQATLAVQAERDRARAYLDLFQSALLRVDSELRILSINARGCELLGDNERNLLGSDWLHVASLLQEKSNIRDALIHFLRHSPEEGSTPHVFESQVPGTAGRRVSWRCAPSRSDSGISGLLCSGEDITQREEREEYERRMQTRLTTVSRMALMGEMSAGIAHELNQPLTAIANYARACERFLSNPSPNMEECRDAMREISCEALRAGDTIRRLRTITRPDSNAWAATDINATIEEVCSLARADARIHDTQLALELADSLPKAKLDISQFQHALLNLLRNALDALSTANPPRRITVATRTSRQGDIEISLCDNGPGIPAEMRDKLFIPFATTKNGHAGLGLAISRTLIHAQGGSLTYSADSSSGACFSISLPAVESTS